jgi:micrococcal nuclease
MYEYRCSIERVVDGDTVDVTIDLGFKIFHKARVRLYGIDTPESRTRDKDEKARGLLAKSYIVDKVESAENIIIRTKKDAKGKFGRILGELIVDNTNLNEAMISKHLGVAYYGQSKEAIEVEHLKNKEILINNNAYQPVI